MKISPRYDGPPVLDVEFAGEPTGALVRQRRRLAEALGSLTEQQWATPSRCEGWTVQDVVSHLIGTDGFWTLAFAAGLRNEPTRFLATFDPVATPAQMVDGMRALTSTEVLAQLVAKAAALEDLLTNIEASQWELMAEAPLGHLALRVAVLHALWDGWVHERDILIPLGLTPPEEPDEVELCLRYVVGLSPAIFASTESGKSGTLTVTTTDPALSLLVEVGTSVRVSDGASPDGAQLSGCAVDLIEGLSHRSNFAHGLRPEHEWLLDGLNRAFDKV